MKLSREMRLLIAKSGADNKWLPLWIHAADTAGVMNELIHKRYASLSELCAECLLKNLKRLQYCWHIFMT